MISFRLANPDDDERIVGILNSCFRTPISIAEWIWFVRGNPIGESHVYVAEDSKKGIIGCYGMFPTQVWISGVPMVVSYGHQLAIDPLSRSGNVFVELSSFVFRCETEFQRPFAIAIANSLAYPLHKKLMNWVDFKKIRVLSRNCPEASTHKCVEISALSPEFNLFLERMVGRLEFSFARNVEWLQWRFLDRPGKPYRIFTSYDADQICGYVVLKTWKEPNGNHKVHIMDIQAATEAAFNDLLDAAEFVALGANELNIWCVDGYVYEKQLLTRGFRANPDSERTVITHSLISDVPALKKGDASYTYADADGY